MSKTFKIIIVFFFLLNNSVIAQTKRFLEVEYNNSSGSYYIGEKFTFKDTNGNLKSGKLYIINDSQFVFLNYFNETSGDTFNAKSIGSMKMTKSTSNASDNIRTRRFIPLGAIIACAFIVPYVSVTFLVLNSTHPRGKSNAKSSNSYTSWVKRNELKISIIKENTVQTE